MKKFISIISIILIAVLLCSCLTGCNKEKTDKNGYSLLTFEMTNDDLSKLENKKVILYGYFMLNSASDTLAYIAPIPFATIYNAEGMNDGTYKEITPSEAQTYSVFFQAEPEYTTAPLKIEGVLKKVDAYDDSLYINYTYAITEATASNVESFSLDKNMREFSTFAREGYLDMAYQNIINLQAFAYGYTDSFPEETYYEEMKADLTSSALSLHKDFLVSIEEIHLLYEKYKEIYEKDKKVDNNMLLTETTNTLTTFFNTMDKYSYFKVEYNEETGLYKLITETNSASIATPDSATTD